MKPEFSRLSFPLDPGLNDIQVKNLLQENLGGGFCIFIVQGGSFRRWHALLLDGYLLR